jgi:hypothetical protein
MKFGPGGVAILQQLAPPKGSILTKRIETILVVTKQLSGQP